MLIVTVLLLTQLVVLVVMAVRSPSLRPWFRAPLLARAVSLAVAWLTWSVVGATAGVVVGSIAIAAVIVAPIVIARLQRRAVGREHFSTALALSTAQQLLGGGLEARRGRFGLEVQAAGVAQDLERIRGIDERWARNGDAPWRPLMVSMWVGSDSSDLARAADPCDARMAPLAIAALARAGHLAEALDRYARCTDLHRFRQAEGLHVTWANLLAAAGRVDALDALLDGPLAHQHGRAPTAWRATALIATGDAAAAAPLLARLDALAPSQDSTTASRLRACGPAPELDVEHVAVLDGIEADARSLSGLTPPTSWARWRPSLTWLVVAGILATFANQLRIGATTSVANVVRAGARVTGAPVPEAHEWWRCGSAMFLHSGWAHLFMNLLALVVLGPIAEWRLGRAGFATVYLGGGVVAFALQSTWHDTPTVAVGASGGIMALVGALVVTSLVARRALPSDVATRELRSWLLLAAFQLVLDRFVENVDRAGHLTGLVVGALLAVILSRIRSVRLAR